MKNLLTASIVTSLLIAPTVQADETLTELKQGAAFTLSGIAGAVAAGPAGLLLGGLGGAWIGDQFKKADQLNETQNDLSLATASIEELQLELGREQSQVIALESELQRQIQAGLARLEFEVMFSTGEDELQQRDESRMDMLAAYLKRNPELKVRLDGFADPRGSDEYNNVLARFRALAVADALYQRGIDSQRISLFHHGAQQSTATSGDYDAYARERRVNIEVYHQENGLAQTH